ncbi:MAG: sugar kinase [Sporolactobacillus sp.]|jgi:2-dehydro-3-deoxygluconokinase|nr:sugar kinase [Sporolactobacillus sp.]
MSELITAGEPMVLLMAEDQGELSRVKHFTRHIGGTDVNVSVGVARLGHSVTFLTQVGEDPFGEAIIDFLAKEKIDTSSVLTTKHAQTGFMLKSRVDNGHSNTFYFRKGSASSQIEENSVDKINFTGAKFLYLGGILAGLSESAYRTELALIKRARHAALTIVFAPGLRPAIRNSDEETIHRTNEIAFLCDIVVLNVGKEKGKEEMADYFLKKGVKQVIIHLVNSGAYTKKKETDGGYSEVFVPGVAAEERGDRLSTGDGFLSGVISAKLEGLSDYDMLLRGNAIGALPMQPIDDEELPTHEKLDALVKKAEMG